MTTPTHSQQMVTKLEALLLANAGVTEVSVDGQRVAYTDLKKDLEYWKKKVANESGTRPRVMAVDLGNF